MQPDHCDAVAMEPGKSPVFWACGVTGQVAVQAARPPFFIAHAPGKMLITGRRHAAGAASWRR